MASFEVEVRDKKYTMEFTRDSVRQYENLGGTISDLQGKLMTSADRLFFVGLNKFHPNISFAQAKEISDESIQDYGTETVYGALVEPFMEVFTSAGEKPAGKSFLVKASKSAAK